MRVVVFGATGNVGLATMRALSADGSIEAIGVARRLPELVLPRVRWQRADIADDPLDVVAGADAVVHLAWRIQPQHDEAAMRATNIGGTARVLQAVADHDVAAVVCASSVGAYAAGPKEPAVDESWPATGTRTSAYSRHKAEVEAMLDRFEAAHPRIRVVRMRTSLVFQRSAASEVHRLFLGRLLPWHLPRPLRLVPRSSSLRFQATHADDVAEAYRLALVGGARGAYNVAAGPVLDPALIARAVGGRTVPVPLRLVRFAADLSFRLRLQPTEAGWLDMATRTPLMDVRRVKAELGWAPRRTSVDALTELLDGIGRGAGGPTRPLHPRRGDPNGG